MLCSTEKKGCSVGAVPEVPYSLGLGNNQKVCEEEKVSLLGLQTCLQLHVAVQDERSVVAHERLHKGTCLWADGGEAAFPAKGNEGIKGKQISRLPVSENQAVTSRTCCQKVIYLTTFQWKVRGTMKIIQQSDSDTKSVRDCPCWVFYSPSTGLAFNKLQ